MEGLWITKKIHPFKSEYRAELDISPELGPEQATYF
jgi:hypothetical protein